MLFRLKTLGIRVEEKKSEERPILRIQEAKNKYRGFLSNCDANLVRLIGFSIEVKRNVLLFLFGLDAFGRGLVELSQLVISQNECDDLLEKWKKDVPFFQEIFPSYSLFLLKEASSLSGKFRKELQQLMSTFSNIKDKIRKPEDLYKVDKDGILKRSFKEIFGHEIFENFTLEWDGIDDDLNAFSEVVNPPMILPQYRMEERKEKFLKSLIMKDNVRSKLFFVRRMFEDYGCLFYSAQDFETFSDLMEILGNEKLYERLVCFFVEKTLLSRKEKRSEQAMCNTPHLSRHFLEFRSVEL